MSAMVCGCPGAVSHRSVCLRYVWRTDGGVILGAWHMQRASHTTKHRFDPLHLLLIVMVAAAALIVSVGAIEFGLHLLIKLR